MADTNPRPPRESMRHSPTSFDFKTLTHVLIERIWVVALCFVAAALLTAGFIKRQPTLYAANALVQVEQEEQKIVKVEKVQQEDLRWLDALRTIEQTLKSRSLLERVAEVNQLSKDPSFVATAEEPTKEQMATILDKIISVRLRRGTRLIDVTVTHTSPMLTAKLANSLVKEFIAQNYEQNMSVAGEAGEYLVVQSRELERKLRDAEKALQAYRDETKSVSLEDNNNIVAARLKELNQKLTDAQSKAIGLKIAYGQVEALGTNVEALLVLVVVNSDPAVVQANQAIAKLTGDFAREIAGHYLEMHPKYQEKLGEIQRWKMTLTNAVLQVPQSLKAAYDSATNAEYALKAELGKQEELARQLSSQLVEFKSLEREVEDNRKLYDAIQTRMKEMMLTRELKPSKVFVKDPARVPSLPVSPNKTQLMIRGLLAGLVAGILVALALNALDSSIKTVDDAEDFLRLPVLSAVPKIKTNKTLVVREDAKSPGAEAFRTLRTSLSMLGRAEHRRTFCFTSAVPQEGKTFCSLNFSICLAQQGLKTLLIDGDLRRPSVEQSLMGKRREHSGVTDYLTGQKKFEDILQTHDQENFTFISAGTTAPNPAELLAQGGFDGLVEEALLRFDRVIVDSAPIHAVSDTLVMLNKIQTVCVVVRAGKTPRKAVARAIEMLHKADAPLGGLILNRQRRRVGGYYYDPYYEYSYHGKYAQKGVYGAR